MLQAYKIDVNIRHGLGWTALMVACVNGRSGVVKVLLQAGANPNLADEFTNVSRAAHERGLHSMEGETGTAQMSVNVH